MSVTDRVRDLVAPICADLGLEIYDVEHASGKVRVIVDKAGGVDLSELAVATRLISRELDQRDPVPGRYQLEVSSPGLERPLRTPAHYRLAVGRTVSIRLQPGMAEPRRLAGLLSAADDEGVTILPEGHNEGVGGEGPEEGDGADDKAGGEADGGPRPEASVRVRYADIERARTTFEWGPQPKPGKGSRTSRPVAIPDDAEETA